MNHSKKHVIVVFTSMLFCVVLGLGHSVFAERKTNTDGLPLNELRAFTEAFSRIKNDYVVPVEDKKLLEDAIRGMLAGLDPHSSYLSSEDFDELRVETSGEFGGLGIEVTMDKDGFVKVISPIDDTPAQHAGIQAGDLIVRLNDSPVKGMSLNDAVKIMRGKPGSEIILTVVREDEERPLKITVVRAVIKVKSVKYRLLDKEYGYLRITRFQAKTGTTLRDAVTKMKQEANGKMKGLVLDLRNNPGGVLNAAVSVSDAFLEKGLIVYTEGRVPDSRLKFKATPEDILKHAPMVVLVNGGSASASEIVAGALQDHHRAIIMGQKTFGKGSVQTILPMKNRGGIKLTTARYYTPLGRSIQADGIIPDIELAQVKVEALKQGINPLKEADMIRHLIGQKEKDGKTAKDKASQNKSDTDKDKDKQDQDVQDKQSNDKQTKDKQSNDKQTKDKQNKDKQAPKDGKLKAKKAKEKGVTSLATKDFALYEALNLLKGINIMREHSR